MKKKSTQDACKSLPEALVNDFLEVCRKHNITFQGQVLFEKTCSQENACSQLVEFQEQANWGTRPVRGMSAIVFTREFPESAFVGHTAQRGPVIQNKDILLKDGIRSQADGKIYTTRKAYNDHLKRHGMVEVGDQAPTQACKEVRGDHDVSKELREAVAGYRG